MAGNYPDAPSRRMAWDTDGTVAVYFDVNVGGTIELIGTEKAFLNFEGADGDRIPGMSNSKTYMVVLLFPELRELDGVFAVQSNVSQNALGVCESSGDTTNGVDGSWVIQIADLPDNLVTAGFYRTAILSLAVATEAAVRVEVFCYSSSFVSLSTLHVYGTISPGETPDRILFLDTLNSDAEFTKVLDYAEVPRGQTQQRTIKLKNNSSSKTINTIQITAEDLYLNAGAFYTFSVDDVAYQATLAYGNLGPGATSTPIYVKQSVPDAEQLGLQTGRLKVSHASLT